MVERSTRGNPRESATETNRRCPPSHVNGGQARVKWCGKSAPASRRRGGWANPTRCKAKRDRLQVARQGPGRPHRWMAAQRQNPAYRPAKGKPRSGGAFLCVDSLGSRHVRKVGQPGAISMESLGAGVRSLPPTTIHTAGAFLAGAADARKGSLPRGELLGTNHLRGWLWRVGGSSPGACAALAGGVGERLSCGVELVA